MTSHRHPCTSCGSPIEHVNSFCVAWCDRPGDAERLAPEHAAVVHVPGEKAGLARRYCGAAACRAEAERVLKANAIARACGA